MLRHLMLRCLPVFTCEGVPWWESSDLKCSILYETCALSFEMQIQTMFELRSEAQALTLGVKWATVWKSSVYIRVISVIIPKRARSRYMKYGPNQILGD